LIYWSYTKCILKTLKNDLASWKHFYSPQEDTKHWRHLCAAEVTVLVKFSFESHFKIIPKSFVHLKNNNCETAKMITWELFRLKKPNLKEHICLNNFLKLVICEAQKWTQFLLLMMIFKHRNVTLWFCDLPNLWCSHYIGLKINKEIVPFVSSIKETPQI
jgi:hypothetical protein